MPKKKPKSSKKTAHFELLPIVVILVAVATLAVIFRELMMLSSVNLTKAPSSVTQTADILSNATVTIPGTSVKTTLAHGGAVFIEDGAQGQVTVTSPYFTVQNPDGNDLYAVMTYSPGGSGDFVTVALFKYANNVPEYMGSFELGDRVTVKNITGPTTEQNNSYTVAVDYLDRTPAESMTDAPTMNKTVNLVIKNHQILTLPQ